MKKVIFFIAILVNYSFITSWASQSRKNGAPVDSIIVLSTPDLFNLSLKWASEYNKLSQESKIKIVNTFNTRMADDILEKGNIAFVSNEYYSALDMESVWKVIVGRDVIVPIINSKNPYVDEIRKRGVSPESLAKYLSENGNEKWNVILHGNENEEINFYMTDDNSISNRLAGFLSIDNLKRKGVIVNDASELIASVQRDPLSVGFCRMINILDQKNESLIEGISLLPIDRNSNGLIDFNEKIYDDFNIFSRGVWIGKYPKALFTNIYSVSSDQPRNESEIEFLKWVINDGQQYLHTNGYSDLLLSERQSAVDKLYSFRVYESATDGDKSLLKTILLFISGLILSGFLVDLILRISRRKNNTLITSVYDLQPVLDENSLLIPKGLYFDKTHTWAFLEQNGVIKVGIDDFIQHITGPITRIKMKAEGRKVKKGEQLVSIIQNGKQLNLYAPVSGTIIEYNKNLNTNFSLINSSPYNSGWIYKIEPTNWIRESQLLFMSEKHKMFLKKEFSRLKDFLADALKNEDEKYAQVILQDGGEVIDGLLSKMGPEVWDDFQTKFIDPSRQIWFYEVF